MFKSGFMDLLENDIHSMTVVVFEGKHSQLFYKALGEVNIDKDELEIFEENLR